MSYVDDRAARADWSRRVAHAISHETLEVAVAQICKHPLDCMVIDSTLEGRAKPIWQVIKAMYWRSLPLLDKDGKLSTLLVALCAAKPQSKRSEPVGCNDPIKKEALRMLDSLGIAPAPEVTDRVVLEMESTLLLHRRNVQDQAVRQCLAEEMKKGTRLRHGYGRTERASRRITLEGDDCQTLTLCKCLDQKSPKRGCKSDQASKRLKVNPFQL